jgi:hypothetical protein
MNTTHLIRILMSFVIGSLCLSYPISATRGQSQLAPDAVGVPSNPIPESRDYATLVLRDAWDLDQPGDVSQYMNESGQRYIVSNLRYEGGVLKGTSVSDATRPNNGYFFPLYMGYATAIKTGKVGENYPISSSTYSCLYVAMKVDSPAAGSIGPDAWRVFWFGDDSMVTLGVTHAMSLYPEAGSSKPNPTWKLYQVNLANPPGYFEASWNSRSSWLGLRIDPTIYANVPYEVDWIRLTDCSSQNAQITFTPNSNISSLWVRPQGANRYIQVAANVKGSSGAYSLDTQGLNPGKYDVALGSGSSCCAYQSQNPLIINQSAIGNFDKPSFTSGEDYATSAGDAWDFLNPEDVIKIQNIASYSFSNGTLDMVTNPGPLPGGQDARIDLNTPREFYGRDYRYLTFEMKTEWHRNWQNVPAGMMARWIWTVRNNDGSTCTLVSQDIPYDIDWNTLTIDLHHSFAGSVEARVGSCSGVANHWKDITQPVVRVRFDPNENVTTSSTWNPLSEGSPFYQQLKAIHLTRVDDVVRGDTYPIQLRLNKSMESLRSVTYYYTTTLADPRQNLAQSPAAVVTAPRQSSFTVTNTLHLPMMIYRYATYQSSFDWYTGAVSPGEYYICAEIDDGYNQTIQCSEAPVIVYAP